MIGFIISQPIGYLIVGKVVDRDFPENEEVVLFLRNKSREGFGLVS